MSLPRDYSVRPATRDDADAITKMFVESEILHNDEPESTVEDLYDDWSSPGFDIVRDTWVVFDGPELVGYAGIVKSTAPDIYSAYGGVKPSHWGRGIGTYLAGAVEHRAIEKAGGPAVVRQWVDAADETAVALFEGRGYTFVRRFWRMDVPLDNEPEAPAEIPGVSIRPFEKGRDERTAHEVLENAFAAHWGFTPKSFEQAAQARWDAEWFRADLSLVAEVDGRMVGVSINGQRLEDGYVEDLGVLPESRGRGIAEALLRTSFRMFHEVGMRRASLNVDSDNSTGAMRLYERVGMQTGTRVDIYERRVS